MSKKVPWIRIPRPLNITVPIKYDGDKRPLHAPIVIKSERMLDVIEATLNAACRTHRSDYRNVNLSTAGKVLMSPGLVNNMVDASPSRVINQALSYGRDSTLPKEERAYVNQLATRVESTPIANGEHDGGEFRERGSSPNLAVELYGMFQEDQLADFQLLHYRARKKTLHVPIGNSQGAQRQDDMITPYSFARGVFGSQDIANTIIATYQDRLTVLLRAKRLGHINTIDSHRQSLKYVITRHRGEIAKNMKLKKRYEDKLRELGVDPKDFDKEGDPTDLVESFAKFLFKVQR